MADAEDPCCPLAAPLGFDPVDAGVSVRERTSGSVGRRSLRSTNPEGACLMGTYRLSSKNFMHFSCAGTTRAGLVKISKYGSGSAFFSCGLSTCQNYSKLVASYRSKIGTDMVNGCHETPKTSTLFSKIHSIRNITE